MSMNDSEWFLLVCFIFQDDNDGYKSCGNLEAKNWIII